MKYVIMADGKGTRWNNYDNHSKHLCVINGETIIGRTVRLLKERDVQDIIITSHNPALEFEGATRYEPLSNYEEIDRFTYEFLNDEITFLYGDTYYSVDALNTIVDSTTDDILFFGTSTSIVGIKIKNYQKFRKYIDYIKQNNIVGKGWTVYQLSNGLPLGSKEPRANLVMVSEETIDIDSPEEYIELKKIKGK